MRVAANSSHTIQPEIERFHGETSFFKERHDEAAEATINVKTNLVLLGKFCEANDVILASIREVDR